MHTRSKQDIIADILKMLGEPKLKTRIMYGANLSHTQSQYYLGLLSSGNLIRRLDDKKWVTTEKGRRFLELYQEAEMMLANDAPAGQTIQYPSAVHN